jgi:hypothetical protein
VLRISLILIIKLISGGRHIVYAGLQKCSSSYDLIKNKQGSRDRMVVGFTTTYAISAYHH